jgi:ParB-like chromosome segregation protein Spo0J
LGEESVPALVVDADSNRRIKLALIENIQRKDMAPLDKAKAFAKLIKNTGLEQQQVAQAIGVAPGYVSQYLTLLALPESAISALRDETLSFTQARVLCRLLPHIKEIDALVLEASNLTAAAMETKVAHILGTLKASKAEAEAEADAEDDKVNPEDADGRPKKKRVAKTVVPDKAVEYYAEADFHPLKKEDIRELMVSYKRKEVNAESEKKREEYRLILKGITLAADLRLK